VRGVLSARGAAVGGAAFYLLAEISVRGQCKERVNTLIRAKKKHTLSSPGTRQMFHATRTAKKSTFFC
jgi:hypothetical protein